MQPSRFPVGRSIEVNTYFFGRLLPATSSRIYFFNDGDEAV